jgi:hypothetical protein
MVVPSTSENRLEVIIIVMQFVTQYIGKIGFYITILMMYKVNDNVFIFSIILLFLSSITSNPNGSKVFYILFFFDVISLKNNLPV